MTINFFQQLINSIKFKRECHKNIQLLSKLNDKTLRDIGVDRCDIPTAVENQVRLKYCNRQPREERLAHESYIAHRTSVATPH